jgi:hypothetical protein
MAFFNDLNVDLNNEEDFPPLIYERTKENPNKEISEFCRPCNESLDAYAKGFISKVVSGLGDAEET